MAPPGFWTYEEKWTAHVEQCHKKREANEDTEYERMIVAVDVYLRKLQRLHDRKKVARILQPK